MFYVGLSMLKLLNLCLVVTEIYPNDNNLHSKKETVYHQTFSNTAGISEPAMVLHLDIWSKPLIRSVSKVYGSKKVRY